MPSKLELYVSGPGTGKTTRCIQVFREKILSSQGGIDSRSFFVLPSREHADRIQQMTLRKEIPGLFNAHILTLSELAAKFLNQNFLLSPTDAVRDGILSSILNDRELTLKYFESIRDLKGFRMLLTDSIKEFKSALLSLEDFETKAQSLLKDPSFKDKFRDFSVVMKRYQERLQAMGLSDTEDALLNLRVAAEEGNFVADLVILDGFYHFSNAQKECLRLIASQCEHVIVTLTIPKNWSLRKNVFDYPLQTRTFLKELGFKECGEGFEISHRTQSPVILHLEESIFKDKPDVLADSSGVTVFEAPDIRAEAQMIAGEILRLYKTSSTQWSDVCVILRNVSENQKIFESVFERYGIPVHVHERKRLTESGFASGVYRFLRLVVENWKKEDLFYVLRLLCHQDDHKNNELLKLQSQASARGLEEGREMWALLVSELGLKQIGELLERLFVCQQKLLLASCARECSSIVENVSADFQRALAEDNDKARLSLRGVLQEADKIADAMSQAVFNPMVYLRELSESLVLSLYSRKPEGKNRVQVYDAIMAMPKEFKVVFLAQLTDKVFPRRADEDALFKDNERQTINRNAGKTLLELRQRRQYGEMYFFYMALSRAKESLYLSYSSHTSDAKPVLKSLFVCRVLECFDKKKLRFIKKNLGDWLCDFETWQTDFEARENLGAWYVNNTADFKSASFLTSAAPVNVLNDFILRGQMDEVLEWVYGTASRNKLEHPVILQKIRSKDIFSPTRLETYAICAFRYFCDYHLHLKKHMDSKESVETGKILHRVLELYFTQRNPSQKVSEDFLELEKLLDFAVTEGKYFLSEPDYRKSAIMAQMKDTLYLFAKRETVLSELRQFVPDRFELDFGKTADSPLGPLVIRDEEGDILIRGQIDRLDIHKESGLAFVVDYKRSKRKKISDKLKKQIELQLPIYLLVAKTLLNLKPVGAELRFLRTSNEDGIYSKEFLEFTDQKIRSGIYENDDFEKILSDSEILIKRLVSEIRRGRIEVKSKSCDFCDFSSVCRFEPWRLVYE